MQSDSPGRRRYHGSVLQRLSGRVKKNNHARFWEAKNLTVSNGKFVRNLTDDLSENKIYQQLIGQVFDGIDPLDSEKWTEELMELSKAYRNK